MVKYLFYLGLACTSVLFMSAADYAYRAKVASGLSTMEFVNTYFAKEEVVTEPLPLTIAAPKVLAARELRELADDELQQRLRAELNANPIWRKLLAEKKMSVGIVDLAEEETAYAAVNGQHMMYAASLPKIAVLAAAHDAIERGELQETPTIKKDMRLMIAKSNNAATTRMIDRVGFENIERTMTDPDLKLYDPAFGGGLWVGKRYAAGGRRYPDPIKGISHAATAEQICRYFYLLDHDKLVSPESCDKMRSYLVDP
ncbi:MAG: serine hydrolase, partial [Bacteroidota bacterium]